MLASRVAPLGDGLDIAFGGGAEHFSPEALAALARQGIEVSTTWTAAPVAPNTRAMRFISQGTPVGAAARRAQGQQPSLAEMTRVALAGLAPSKRGFFLMVEGGQIDWRLHEMERGMPLIDEVRDFDETVALVHRFAQDRGDTLIIVTADHDHTMTLLDDHYGFHKNMCGLARRCDGEVELIELPLRAERLPHGTGLGAPGAALRQPPFAEPGLLLQYAWLPSEAARRARDASVAGPHSANFVPLFAYGPGAQAFGGFHDQPEVGAMLVRWARGEGIEVAGDRESGSGTR